MSKGNRAGNTTELRMSLSHAITVIGLFIGCLVASFVIGYRSGKTYGYEDAARASLANLPRFRVPQGEQPAQVSEEFVSKVYSRLQQNIEGPTEDSTPPKLEKITEVLPVESEKRKLGDIAPDRNAKKKKQKKEKEAKKAEAIVTAEKKVVEVEKPVQVASVKPDSTTDAKPVEKVVEEKKEEAPETKPAESKTVGGLFELGNTQQQAPVKATPIPQKPPAAAAVKTPQQTAIPAGWYVQVAAPNNESEAGQLVSRLKQNGFRDSRIQPAKVKGKQYFRVLVGPETTAVLAERLLEQLKREPYVKFKPYLKRIPR